MERMVGSPGVTVGSQGLDQVDFPGWATSLSNSTDPGPATQGLCGQVSSSKESARGIAEKGFVETLCI